MEKTRAVKIFLALGKITPRIGRKAGCGLAALLFYYLFPRHRLITIHNLYHAFPDKSLKEIRKLARRVYLHLGVVVAEFFDLPFITKENYRRWVEFEGLNYFYEAKSAGKGVIASVSHFGNWEMMAVAFAQAVEPLTIMYRPLDSPLLNEIVTFVRSYPGNILLTKEGSMRKALRALYQHKVLCILNDQNVDTREGVFVDFFGRPACTGTGLATLAMHTGAPILPVFMPRLKSGKYRMIFLPPFTAENTGDYERDLQVNTQRVAKILEEMVTKYPDQWLWLHQRWKTKMCQLDKKDGNR
ncbi:MAG TPA: lysophospholipid acyltransferase family protein [Syntrophales bacterium]|nr:lysophospholipid acyltransferase family protein [Syntrophales bacterium]HOL59343.1 lysophospholipid acyltransferase family protein [Syntrophales bacterium]HPO35465.1 lysophospholipid acyltransferase family protein [Syntrophales bacterium]